MMTKNPMCVTKNRLPEPESFSRLCRGTFQHAWITNNGQCAQKLEYSPTEYFGVSYVLVCINGTIFLMLAIHCGGLSGKKVAVTQTYVATLSALFWLHCTSVFVDTEPDTLRLARDVEALESICREWDIVLICDAIQFLGSRYQAKSLQDYGDYSICSFHVTKIFHTAEGGCSISHNADAHNALALASAFGHINGTHYGLDIKGKRNELPAATGLSLLAASDAEIARRKDVRAMYDAVLDGLPLKHPAIRKGQEWSKAYYPALLPEGDCRGRVEQAQAAPNIYSHFYSALNTLSYLNPAWTTLCLIAEDAARRILCLPMYAVLRDDDMERTAQAIRMALACDVKKTVRAIPVQGGEFR